MILSGIPISDLRSQSREKQEREAKEEAERKLRQTFRDAEKILRDRKEPQIQTPTVPVMMKCTFHIPLSVSDRFTDDPVGYVMDFVGLARQLKGRSGPSKLFTVIEADFVDGAIDIATTVSTRPD